MNYYDDANRGQFQSEQLAKQLVSFEGMRFTGRSGIKNVTPTDIDGLVQLDAENCIIFFELKHSGNAPPGQLCALKKMVDAIEKGGVNSAAFVATHNTPFPETIEAKNAIVNSIYWRGKWWEPKKQHTLYEYMEGYVKYIKKENGGQQ